MYIELIYLLYISNVKNTNRYSLTVVLKQNVKVKKVDVVV